MAITVHCDIVSAEENLFSGQVERVVASGILGDLGIEPGHAALITPLQPGPVRIVKQNGEEEIVYVSGGFLEVQPNSVTVLADTAVRADDLDEAAALEAKKHAEQAMENQGGDFDYSRAMSQLAIAAGQLRAIQQIREKLGKR
ncbi:MAG: F0F1 ATP synthase subunit epsilon [Thalassolituus sp.]|jgi:F-type H+-transporting ATPase subunit epsilon|uniref:ATP synthase epsilon chain n=2 Tax=root TaxID=1 RepID=M5DW75_9GAMM|nr:MULTISPECIES: F0F1 ATP synthase subunit epsilon [Thalassolituus]PCI47315.1 MAG: F0F1 ATP synthase subunit epsilon [Oceanospirillales bacterium]PHQ87366.1 MAG: F0F1 ATP synthase subunit epsilon [Thalassobium sp.]AHK17111.1 F0F1 ATP synthase subunit epsilon [Thalassolituus oleivorans R6-15]APR65516.1 F0F1 ATP synthase subunit epsilon [Thalassolituus oleivorans]MBQ0728436.1 F0F1 ATP synthase subunit epsilon [Thalassolituus oleivorans]|tara:strand:+ start:772 stop:1200 length:429 start_codon:yes stop_codon:yes gene_type:complete